jgi:hypothetical protein
MNISLCLRPTQRIEQRIDLAQLAIAGGASESIFPLVEAWLQESTDHWNALRVVSCRKADPGFRSVVDFVVVSVCPELRRACFRFYEDEGMPMRELIGERERLYIERKALLFLEVAYAAFSEKRRLSWAQALSTARELEVA